MNRRPLIGLASLLALSLSIIGTGCRRYTHAQVVRPDKKDMVGTTGAGAETFKPLVEEAICRLLERHANGIESVEAPAPGPVRICFVGVENKSAEEIGDFKEQIYEHIDDHIEHSNVY